MHGNVDEWCRDGQPEYSAESVVDPEGATEEGAYRVVRGGSWNLRARYVRAACRYRWDPDDRYYYLGFRCARVQDA